MDDEHYLLHLNKYTYLYRVLNHYHFDLKFPNENYYKPKNKNSLNDLVAKGLTKGKFYATPSYEKFHKEFIDINLNFSKSLNKFGINCTQIKPV